MPQGRFPRYSQVYMSPPSACKYKLNSGHLISIILAWFVVIVNKKAERFHKASFMTFRVRPSCSLLLSSMPSVTFTLRELGLHKLNFSTILNYFDSVTVWKVAC